MICASGGGRPAMVARDQSPWSEAQWGADDSGMREPEQGSAAGGTRRPVLLVDVRPTTCGYRALVWALTEAERRDAELLAVTFWPGDPAEPDGGRSEMHQALMATVRRAVEETGVHGRTRVEVVTGPVSLTEVAAVAGAELVVLASEEVAS
jgi:hypothetical protein